MVRCASKARHRTPGTPGRWEALRDFLRLRAGDRNEVLRWDDPAPFVRETIDWVLRR